MHVITQIAQVLEEMEKETVQELYSSRGDKESPVTIFSQVLEANTATPLRNPFQRG
jgi:hypothetical protein